MQLIAAGTTPESLIAFRPSYAVQHRICELVARDSEGQLSAEERSERDDLLQLKHLMVMASAQARRHLNIGRG